MSPINSKTLRNEGTNDSLRSLQILEKKESAF